MIGVYVCEGMRAMAHMWGSEGLVLPSCGSSDQTQAIRLGSPWFLFVLF